MVKKNQPVRLDFTISHDADTFDAASATIDYQKPSGATGSFSSDVTLDTATPKVTYDIAENILDETGEWRFVGQILFNDGLTYPTVAARLMVRSAYS